MNPLALCVMILLVMVFVPLAWASTTSNPQVVLETNHGAIVIELYPEQAPKTVNNFLQYVNSGFYNETIFHRVISGFMIQGGGFTVDMQQKTTQAPIENEANNGLKNERGTIAMARTNQPHSATAQFFINTVDNSPLDHRSQTGSGWGYCVFGRVIKGMDVVDTIERLPTGNKGMYQDVPIAPAIITKAVVQQPEAKQ